MESARFKLNQIHVIMLGVKDVAGSTAFYRDKLGMTVNNQTAEFAFLDGGKVTLMLSKPLYNSQGRPRGATEVVFSVESVRDAYDSLRAQGIKFTQEPRNVAGTFWAANFDDPEGHHLSVFGPEHKA